MGTIAARLAVGMLAAMLAIDAGAQPKPALTRNVDEPGRSPYVESVQVVADDTTTCPPALASCTVVFAAVPAGRRLVITYASAAFYLVGGGTGAEASLSAPGTGFIVLPQPQVQTGINDRHTVATPVTFYVEPGQAPRVVMRGFNFAAGFLLTVALSGYYVTLP